MTGLSERQETFPETHEEEIKMTINRNDTVEVVTGSYAGQSGIADKVYSTSVCVNLFDGPMIEVPKSAVRVAA